MNREDTQLEHEFIVDPELVLRDSTGPAKS
jgi:hypothetical protein